MKNLTKITKFERQTFLTASLLIVFFINVKRDAEKCSYSGFVRTKNVKNRSEISDKHPFLLPVRGEGRRLGSSNDGKQLLWESDFHRKMLSLKDFLLNLHKNNFALDLLPTQNIFSRQCFGIFFWIQKMFEKWCQLARRQPIFENSFPENTISSMGFLKFSSDLPAIMSDVKTTTENSPRNVDETILDKKKRGGGGLRDQNRYVYFSG